MNEPAIATIEIGNCTLRTATWGESVPEIIMLHDGLGSIPQWRSVPGEVARRTNMTVLAYERAGHGQSQPIPNGPWPTDWLHREAAVLGDLIAAVGARQPILVGHSDGGSAALIHTAQPACAAVAVLALAPHSWVEQVCLAEITGMRANAAKITMGLAPHHRAPHELFEAWSGVWVSDEFRSWDIRPELAAITVPTMIAQGADDTYASDEQAHSTARAIGASAWSEIVDGVGHIMHHDDAETVIGLITGFVEGQSA